MTTRATDATQPPIVVPVHTAPGVPPDIYDTAGRLRVLQHLPQVIDLTREIFGTFPA